jgi:hypothetical protein
MSNLEIISVHIPKTAGTTLRNLLIQIYGKDQVCTHYPDSPQVDGTRTVTPETKVVHGHFHVREYLHQFPDAKKIAWVRHPITRLISHYFYNKNHPHTINQDMEKTTLIEYAELPWKQNEIAKHLKGAKISDYYFLGIQEFFAEDLADLQTMLGWSEVKKDLRDNTNLSTKYYEVIQDILSQPKVLNKLIELNYEDMEVYQEVLNLRAKRRQESGHLYGVQIGWQWAQVQIEQMKASLEKAANYSGQRGFLQDTAKLDDVTFVRQVYLTYLEREPDLNGQTSYIQQLQRGMLRQELVDIIQNSQEFKNKQEKLLLSV